MREREVRLGSGVYAMRYWGEHGVIKPWRYRKGGQGGGGRRWNWRREWKSEEGVETGVNCREWQSGVGKHGRGGVRSVCYAVGIKQCPSSRDAARRRRRRRLSMLLLPALLRCCRCRSCLLREEKKAEWLLETVYISVYEHVYMYFVLYICIYMYT